MAPEHERKIITDCYREGMPLPAKIRNAPELQIGLELYFDAFFELSTCRQVGFGLSPIPWSAIREYALTYGLDDVQTEDLTHHIRTMDEAFLKHHSRTTAKPKEHGKRVQ